MLTQVVLIYRILNEKKNAMECYAEGHLTLNGSFERAELRSVCPPMAEVGIDLAVSIIRARTRSENQEDRIRMER